MGTWDSGINSGDSFADVYDSFFEFFDNNFAIDEIMDKLALKYNDAILDEDNANEFYLAVSKALWECGSLNNIYLDKIKTIIDSKSEMERWLRLGAKEEDARKRQAELMEFYGKISVPKVKPKRPAKPKYIDSAFRKGDCIAVRDTGGTYYAAVILYDEQNTRFGFNLVMILDYAGENPPGKNDFTDRYRRVIPDVQAAAKPAMIYCYANELKNLQGTISKICSMEIEKDYPFSTKGVFASWNSIIRPC